MTNRLTGLYRDSLGTDGSAFVNAIVDLACDNHDLQRLSKKIATGITCDKILSCVSNSISETAEFITHVSKLTRNMCEMVCHQNRLAANLTMLESLYVPNFVRETGLGSLSSRYQRCHQNYFSSFVGGLPGIEVIVISF